MNISGPAAVAKPEMLFYAPGDLTVTYEQSADVKTHHYIISFDPKDAVENGLTMERAQALYAEAPRLARGYEALQHSPDHAALAC